METLMRHLADASSAPDLAVTAETWLAMRARRAAIRAEHGMTTETVIITAGLSALAVAVVAIIVGRVMRRANTIQ